MAQSPGIYTVRALTSPGGGPYHYQVGVRGGVHPFQPGASQRHPISYQRSYKSIRRLLEED